MTDDGYFGPESITWRVMAEPVTFVGGLRALLLQALHPEAMRLLALNTRYRNAPWTRLQHTGEFVGTVTFAPRADVDAAAARVRAIHHKLGVDKPDLLAWIHATEIDSFLIAARRAGAAISAAEADVYIAEQRISGRLVGVPESLLPTSMAQLRSYLHAMRPQLHVTLEAVAGVRFVLAPPMSVPLQYRLPARLGWTSLAGLAVGLLPRWARRMYGLPGLPPVDLANALALRALRVAAGAVPAHLRQAPVQQAALARAALAS